MNLSRNKGFCTYVVWVYFFILAVLTDTITVCKSLGSDGDVITQVMRDE